MNIIKEIFDTFEEAFSEAMNSKEPTGVQYHSKIKKYVTTKSDITNTKVNKPIKNGGKSK